VVTAGGLSLVVGSPLPAVSRPDRVS